MPEPAATLDETITDAELARLAGAVSNSAQARANLDTRERRCNTEAPPSFSAAWGR